MQPVQPDTDQTQLLAEQLELLAARDHGLAAHIGHERFALLLPGQDGESALARLQSLREALQPQQLWVGIAVLAAGAEDGARRALLQRAEQALEVAIAASAAEADAAGPAGGLHWQIAP